MEAPSQLTQSLTRLLLLLTFFISFSANSMPVNYDNTDRYFLSRLVELGNFDQLIDLLTLRKDCHEHASYEDCGMTPDKIINYKDQYGRDLLHQMLSLKMDDSNSPEMNAKMLTIASLLISEGVDYLHQYQGYGDNAASMAIKGKKKDIFLAMVEDSIARGDTEIFNFAIFDEKLVFLAAHHMPFEADLHQALEKHGFDYDEINNRYGLSARQLIKNHIQGCVSFHCKFRPRHSEL